MPHAHARRAWLLPAPSLVQLGFALARLAIVGLIAIGVSGGIAAIFGAAFGKSFVAGDRPGVSYTRDRCADYFEYAPGAKTCEEAATIHHFGETVQYPMSAGLLGVLGLGVYGAVRRRLRGDPNALPQGFEATVGTAMFGVAAAALLATALNQFVVRETAGVGAPLAEGIVAAVTFVIYGVTLYRTLLRRATTPRPDPS